LEDAHTLAANLAVGAVIDALVHVAVATARAGVDIAVTVAGFRVAGIPHVTGLFAGLGDPTSSVLTSLVGAGAVPAAFARHSAGHVVQTVETPLSVSTATLTALRSTAAGPTGTDADATSGAPVPLAAIHVQNALGPRWLTICLEAPWDEPHEGHEQTTSEKAPHRLRHREPGSG